MKPLLIESLILVAAVGLILSFQTPAVEASREIENSERKTWIVKAYYPDGSCRIWQEVVGMPNASHGFLGFKSKAGIYTLISGTVTAEESLK